MHFALLDPDKQKPSIAGQIARTVTDAGSSAIMVGGSTLTVAETGRRSSSSHQKKFRSSSYPFPIWCEIPEQVRRCNLFHESFKLQ